MNLLNPSSVQGSASFGTLQGAPIGYPQTDAPTANSPAIRMGMSIEQARSAAQRLEHLSDQLCGSVPTPVGKEAQASNAGGLFGALGQSADDLSMIVGRMEEAMSRIYRQLPNN